MCRNKRDRTWWDGMELGRGWSGDGCRYSHAGTDTSPRRLLVWASWPHGSNRRINWFLKATSPTLAVLRWLSLQPLHPWNTSAVPRPQPRRWFPQGQMAAGVTNVGRMEPFDSSSPWFVQLDWQWQKRSPGTWCSRLRLRKRWQRGWPCHHGKLTLPPETWSTRKGWGLAQPPPARRLPGVEITVFMLVYNKIN